MGHDRPGRVQAGAAMVQVKRSVLLLGLTALTACRFPPFNPGVSLARLTADRLDRLGVVGPFVGTIDTSAHHTFVPERAILQGGPLQGWILGVLPTYMAVRYAWGGSTTSPGQWTDSLWDDEGAQTLLRASVTFDRLLVMRFSTPSQWTWIGLLRSSLGTPEDPWIAPPGVPPDYDFKNFILSQPVFVSMVPDVVGPCVFPPDPAFPSQRQLRFLAPGGGTYQEGEVTFEGFGPPYLIGAFLVPSPPVTGLPSPIERTSFYHHSTATGDSYLSVSGADGGYVTYRWDGSTSAAVALPLSMRVDAALSTGRLFSRDEEEGYVFDSGGERLARFPMGDLDFVGEYWDSAESRYRMVFVLPLLVGGEDDGERELSFEVYSWPTSEVTSLD